LVSGAAFFVDQLPDVIQLNAKERVRSFILNGAPRPMKMGGIASPWRYDAALFRSIKPPRLRRPIRR
jgi:hypothetical protein